MLCQNCGANIPDLSLHCPVCGAECRPRSERVTLCEDGKYRWVYSMSLFKDPSVFLLIWKIFFFIILGIFAFTTLIDGFEWGFSSDSLLGNLKMFGVFTGGMTVLTLIGYLVYAAIMGGKYTVEFEMDGNGVNHRQIEEQAKKARKIGQAASLAGAAGGSLSTVGAGMNVRTEMYSDFSKTRKVKLYKRRGLIKVNSGLDHNQVYVKKEDFDFVANFVISHCPNLKKRPK